MDVMSTAFRKNGSLARRNHQSLAGVRSTRLRLMHTLIDFIAIGIQFNNLITKLR